SLAGTYVDAKNSVYSGSVTLASFQSLVLVKTSKDTEKPETPAVEAKPLPAATAYYFNTTTNAPVLYQNAEFQPLASEYLVTGGSNVGTNRGASKDELFQKERFATEIGYFIPVPNGTYTVKTYHNETYYGKSGRSERAGLRVFDIEINGTTVKKGFDIFVENQNKETVLEFANIVVKNGRLEVKLLASANNATISGIAVIDQGTKATEKKPTADAKPSPATTAYYFNTTTNAPVLYQNAEFQPLAAEYLLTGGSNVGTNRGASKDELFQKERFATEIGYFI